MIHLFSCVIPSCRITPMFIISSPTCLYYMYLPIFNSIFNKSNLRMSIGYLQPLVPFGFRIDIFEACCVTRICCFRSILFYNHYFEALNIKAKCFCKAMTKISNEFYQIGLTIINFFKIFGTRSIKTRKNWPIFSSLNPFPSMRQKQFQCIQIVEFR